MKPRFKLILILLFILCKTNAQDKFVHQTFTDSVLKDGFYQINLLPSITAKSKPALDDIRLFDKDNKQVPYLIKNGENLIELNSFLIFKKITEEYGKDSIYKIIVENIDKKHPIDNIVFILQNSLVKRNIDISGSFDKIHWYALGDYIPLEKKPTDNSNSDEVLQIVNLPKITFSYFLIKFKEKQQDPILIKSVGTYKGHLPVSTYFPLPKPLINQVDRENKKSYINVIFIERYNIDKIEVYSSGVKLYNRTLLFTANGFSSDKFQRGGMISSQNENIFNALSFKKTDTLKFNIQNDDNPPLKIDSVKAYQNAYALFAYLKAGQKYKVAFGNDSLAAPVYDISAFSDSIKNATLLSTNEITENHFTKESIKSTDSFNSKIWLWTAIITVLLILLYFTSSMLKQINKRK